ncbi:MAG: pentapeptide repeat-containing protein [Aggregatilineales bacterium]
MALQIEKPENRWHTITQMWNDEKQFYRILGGLFLVALGVILGGFLFGDENPAFENMISGVSSYATNLWTEAISVILTIAVLNYLNERRDERRRVAELKERLVREVRSQSPEVAKAAISELHEHGWLEGENGLLKGRDLVRSNLHGLDLRECNLQEANLHGVNLQFAQLNGANLRCVDLSFASLQNATLETVNLENAVLMFAKLQDANFLGANLSNVDMKAANLHGTNLSRCNLKGANFSKTKFDSATTLPNREKWSSSSDLMMFTNPDHPHFWLGLRLEKAENNDLDFSYANLCGVFLFNKNLENFNLQEANLQGGIFYRSKFNKHTVLPDGKKWTPDTDMAIFTDPSHPNFWRSDDPRSPAYRGDK